MKPNFQQTQALGLMEQYIDDIEMRKEIPVLKIGGIAGSGKSWLLGQSKKRLKFKDGQYWAMGYTGQAAKRLRQVGFQAGTIHSTAMKPKYVPKMKDGKIVEVGGIPRYMQVWDFVDEIPEYIDKILIDEGSFVSEAYLNRIIQLAKPRNLPIIMTGDPLQLPPVIGESCFRESDLHYFMDSPVRQSLEYDIIKLATALRLGERIDIEYFNTNFFKSKVGGVLFMRGYDTPKKMFKRYKQLLTHCDMIIAATNKQRLNITKGFRNYVFKTDSEYPVEGERLVCRRNSSIHALNGDPLTNGTVGICLDTVGFSQVSKKNKQFMLNFQPLGYTDDDYYSDLYCDTEFLQGPFGAEKRVDPFNNGLKFEYAHAITAHLSQGGEFDHMAFLDRYMRNEEYLMRIRYTALTRAKKQAFWILD